MNQIKHQPTTPLPWPNDENTDSARLMRGGRDAIYARHAANAYPKLVEALNKIADYSLGSKVQPALIAREMLRELGEAA